MPSKPRVRTNRHTKDNPPRARLRHIIRKPLPYDPRTPSMGRLAMENPRHTPTTQSNHTSTPPRQPTQIYPITQATRQTPKPLHSQFSGLACGPHYNSKRGRASSLPPPRPITKHLYPRTTTSMPRHQPNNDPLPHHLNPTAKHHNTRPSHTTHKTAPKELTTSHHHNTDNYPTQHKTAQYKPEHKQNRHTSHTHLTNTMATRALTPTIKAAHTPTLTPHLTGTLRRNGHGPRSPTQSGTPH
jgi:hypothetical protein